MIGDERTPVAHRAPGAVRGVMRGLEFELGVELGPEEDDVSAEMKNHIRATATAPSEP